MGLIFEAVFPSEALSAVDMAKLCLESLPPALRSRSLSLYGVRLAGEAALFRRLVEPHFEIRARGWCFRWAAVKGHDHSYLQAEGTELGDPEPLLEAIEAKAPLISARVFDADYDYWQNAADPVEFEDGGRSMVGLRMVSNALPPPLERMMVDPSGNPGRRVAREGYVEGIGHKMWLGPELFARVRGVKRRAILSSPLVQVSKRRSGLLMVVAQDEPFTDETTAEKQEALRRLIFGAPKVASRV